MKKAIVLLIFSLFVFAGRNQLNSQRIPQAYRSLLNGKSPAAQVDILDSIAAGFRTSEPAKAEQMLRLSIAVAAANKLDSAECQQRISLGKMLRFKGDFIPAENSLDTAVALAEKNNFSTLLLTALDQRALVLSRSGDYVGASKQFFHADSLAEKFRNVKLQAVIRQHLGSMYFYMKDWENAIAYTKLSLAGFESIGDSTSVASNLDNIGLYYQNNSKYDSAKVYQLKALNMFILVRDSINLMICYNNMGALLTNMKNYGEAEPFLKNALSISEKKKDSYRIMTSLISLGVLYNETNQSELSIAHLKRAYQIAVEIKDEFHSYQCSSLLAGVYFKKSDFTNAAYYYNISDRLKSVVYDGEKTKAVNEISQKYETAQRKKQIELLQAEKKAADVKSERDRLLKIVFAVIGIALLFFSIITVRRYLRKKKDNALLHEKNEAIAFQKKLIEEKNHEILDSINYATRIQNAVLPSMDRVHFFFPDSFVYYRPRDIISGDFFWVGSGKNGVKYIAVADCTGHGVPGAMMSMLGSSLLNQILNAEQVLRPGKILDMLHEKLIRLLNESTETRSINDGMDIALLMHDPVNKIALVASADRPVYFVRDGKLTIIPADKISIGSTLSKTEPYRDIEIKLDSPAQFYLFSDGITDQFGGPASKKFMSKRLQQLVLENSALSLNERERVFTQAFDDWKKGTEQTDDMTLLHLIL